MHISGSGGVLDGASRAQEMFQKIDVDGNGQLTKDELKAGRPSHGNGPSIDDLFSGMDANGDGAIDQAENQAFAESMQSRRPQGPPDPAQMAKRLFEKADQDQDGTITKDQLQQLLPPHDSSSAFDQLFKEADGDGDGAITQSELEAGLKAHFEQRVSSYASDGSTRPSAGSRLSRLG